MLVVFIRTIIIYISLLIGIRLMGKRTIGELQPFELVITLAIADLACMPMQDISVPLVYGLVPLFTMFLLHLCFTWLATKSIKFRRALNGKPVIVVTPDGIDSEAMAKLNFTVNDLMESLRSQQIFSVDQIKYAVLETNGNLSVMENENAQSPECIPVTLVIEGKKMQTNYSVAGVDDAFVENILREKNFKTEDVVLFTKANDRIFIQPRGNKFVSETLDRDTETVVSGADSPKTANGANI